MFNKKFNPLLRKPRIVISLLTALCWIAALANILLSFSDDDPLQSGNTIPAYSTISSECSTLLHDNSLQCIFSHSETSYDDYYFFSPVLDSMGYPCSSQGYNLHVAVTKSGHTYLGFPQITHDF